MKASATKKSKKDNQHVVPRTYLKHWKIAEDKNFVYGIDLSNKYKKGVQTFGLNDTPALKQLAVGRRDPRIIYLGISYRIGKLIKKGSDEKMQFEN